MKRAFPLFCALALLLGSCTSEPETPRVIVLGIDGGTWTVIEPMMEAGELPNLKKLYDKGLHGILESRPPIISPVVWTTIFTGFLHAKHGIKDWKTSQSVNRRVSAIWEILADRKIKSDVFNVPATWPPDPVPGVMLSGFPLSGSTFGGNTGEVITSAELDSGKLPTAYRDSVEAIRSAAKALQVGQWSPWFEGKVASRPTFRGMMRAYRLSADEVYVTPHYRVDPGLVVSEPKTLRAELGEKLGEPYIPEGPGWSRWAEKHTPEVLYDHLDQVFATQSKAALEFAASDWKLFIYVMTFVDRVSHPYWAYGHAEDFPTMDPEKAKKYGSAVADAYRRSDEEVGRILAKAPGDPYVVIVSDHGFQSSSEKAIGGHNPDGIYLVAGPGITAKTGVPKFIEDVTPTLLYMMNLPVGQDMDGQIFAEVQEMLGREPESVPSHEVGDRDATDNPVDDDTWESLRGLGYVDGAPPRAADKDKPGVAKPGAKKPPMDKGAEKKPGASPGRVPPKKAPAKPPAANAPAPEDNALENWPESKGPKPEPEGAKAEPEKSPAE